MTRMLAVSVMVAVWVGVVGVGSALAKGGRLDGQVYEAAALEDTLTFEHGWFNTAKSAAAGYAAATYQASPWAGGVGFRARLTNAAGERMEWRGLIKGGSLDGEVSRVEGGRRVKTAFIGTLAR